MTIFEVYEMKEKAIYPKTEFRDDCMKLLLEAEANDKEWLEVGEKAPTKDVLVNILTRRTALTNPLWKKTLMKGLGYNSITEMLGE